MFTRQCLAVAVVFAGLSVGLSSLHADESEMSAVDLYQQGMELFESGELDAARDTFHRVDPMQLPKEDRLNYYEAIKTIDQKTANNAEAAPAKADADAPADQPAVAPKPHPSQMLWQADEAMATNPSLAAALYEAVIMDKRSDDNTVAQAKARLAQANRLAAPAVNAAREHLDLATEAIDAKRYEAARGHLGSIKASGVVLGWRDQARLDRINALIKANTPEAPKAPEADTNTQADDESAEADLPAIPVATVVAAENVSAPTAEEQAQATQAPSGDLLRQVRLSYAQQKAAEAAQAQEDGQLRLAIELYKEAVELNPDNAAYKKSLENAISLQNKNLVPKGILDEVVSREQVKAQEVTAEFRASMNTARSRMSTGEYNQAFDAVADAKVVLDRNQRFLAPQTYRQLRSEAESLSSQIEAQRGEAQAQALKEEEQTRLEKEEEARVKAAKEMDQEIQRLLRRALDLQREMKYEQALELLDQALFLDPNDVAVHALKEMIEETNILVEAREAVRQRDLLRAKQSVINIETSTPYDELIRYPADWPQISPKAPSPRRPWGPPLYNRV